MRNFNQLNLANMDQYISDPFKTICHNKSANIRLVNIPYFGIKNLPIPKDFIIMINDEYMDDSFDSYIEGIYPFERITFINKNPKIIGRNFDINKYEDNFYDLLISASTTVTCYIVENKCIEISFQIHYLTASYTANISYSEIKDKVDWIE